MEDTPETKDKAVEGAEEKEKPEPLIDIPKEELQIEEPKEAALLPQAPSVTVPVEKKETVASTPFTKRLLQKNDPLLLPTQRVSLLFKIVIGTLIVAAIGLTIFFFSQRENTPPVSKATYTTAELASLSWNEVTEKAPWQERDAPATFLFNNAMYIAGGIDGNEVTRQKSVEYWNAEHFNDIWKSTDGTTWEQVTKQAEWSNRRSMSIIPFKGELFLVGGWAPEGGYKKIGIWKSSDAIDWEQVTETPDYPPREGQTVEVFKNKLWMFGGVNFDNRETLNDVWYSDNGVRWQKATTTTPWDTRYDHGTVVLNDTLYLLGGRHLDGTGTSDVWATKDGFNWELLTNTAPWGPLHGHSVVSYKDALWVVGGWDTETDTGFQETWFSHDGKNWTKVTTDNPWVGREDHSVLVFNDSVYVYAGMITGYLWVSDVWKGSLSTTTSINN